MDLSIVIPVYNSQKSLNLLVTKIIDNLIDISFEIILVDDGSIDNSFNEILKLSKENENILGIKLDKNYGQQNATFCGIVNSSGKFIVTIDDDLQHPVECIEKLFKSIKEGYDVCYGIYTYSDSSVRKAGSLMRDFLFNYLIGKPKGIDISSFRVINRDIVNKIKKCDYKFINISAQILKETKNISNLKVEKEPRLYGNSGYNFKKLLSLYLKTALYYSKFSFYPEKFKKGKAYKIESKTE
ncbi:glycosyltransferase family 2 protein [Helicovermis profundi]|uniref:Glycosyltransferase 2-like domain-containing protein n=1 Tax=Helicovermis profundi TaxID=3065157 RepID=A0AAU9ED43_9FIRM|nr:hypothetical protein HLPR_08480 [Clostridia bacterium S502]